MEYRLSQMVMNIEAITKPENLMVTASIDGPTGPLISANLGRECVKAKAVGRAKAETSIKAITAPIAKTAGGSSDGPMATSTEGNSART